MHGIAACSPPHRWRIRAVLALGALALLPGRAGAADALPALRVVTGDLPPFAVEGHPEAPGVLVELVEQVLVRSGQPVRAEFYPWARAMATASSQARVAILPLTRTPEREAQFQWLLKLYVQHFSFINRSSQHAVTDLAQARRLRLAVLRGSPNVAQLQRHGFDVRRAIQANSVEEMLRLLEKGLVDALFGGDLVCMDKVRSSGRNPADFQIGLLLESREVWLAGGKGFSEADGQRLREAHQALLREGVVERLFQAYGIRPRAEDLR